MQQLRAGFSLGLLFALVAIGSSGIARAQDMPPILAPLAPAAAVAASPPSTAPSAQAAIPPAPSGKVTIPPAIVPPHVTPAAKAPVAAVDRTAAAQYRAKSAAEKKRL